MTLSLAATPLAGPRTIELMQRRPARHQDGSYLSFWRFLLSDRSKVLYWGLAVTGVAVALSLSMAGGSSPSPDGTMPTVQNTGVPLGFSVPTSQHAYFGEGLTDTRPVEALTPASSTSVPGWTPPDAHGIAYLSNSAPTQSYDHVDFTNVKLVVPASVLSVEFTKCRFRTTEPALSLNRAQGGSLVQVLGTATAVTFIDCSLDGSTPNANFAVQNFLSMPDGNTSPAGVTYRRNNISGFSTLLSVGSWRTFLFDANYCHDAVIDKHHDVAPYTNATLWAHVDGLQIGAANHVGTGRVTNNVLLAFSATNQIASGPLQIGQMAGPAPAQIDSFVFDGNFLDGGSYIVGANLGTAIQVNKRFEITNNKIGLGYIFGIDGGETVHRLATLWLGNTYAKSGTVGRSALSVYAGQSIP